MHSLLCGVALALLLPAMVNAQRIRGVVVEDSTGVPIPGVKVELLADTTILATALSAASGWFDLALSVGGRYLVRASHAAYRSSGMLAVEIPYQQTITVVLRLSGGPIPLEPLVVKATAVDRLSGFRERARRVTFGRFLTRADIDNYGAHSLAHLLRFTPEVIIDRVRVEGFVTDGVFMRSFGDVCVPAVYLDGVHVPTGRVFDINDLISVESVEGVEVYRNAMSAPMEFRMGAFNAGAAGPPDWCRVIAVWSRPGQGRTFTLKRMAFAGLLAGASVLFAQLFR